MLYLSKRPTIPVRWLWLSLPFLALIALRAYLIPTERMPFDSDEAIFLLMAKHIVGGERPLFFYGEAYGGSADSYLTALFFYLVEDNITVARWVQTAEYAVGMIFTYLFARRILPDARWGSLALLWLMAIPPLLMTTWTTPAVLYAVVVGGGSIITYLGHRLLHEDADTLWRWLLFGAVCGLGFWTFGILVVYMLPVFLLFLWRFRLKRLPLYAASAVAFFLFSFPWWTQAIEGLFVVYNPEAPPAMLPFVTRLLAFFTIMLPNYFGISEPWRPEILWPFAALLVTVFYLLSLLFTLPFVRRTIEGTPRIEATGFALLGVQVIIWSVLYFGTRFSMDPTGRYIIPLYPVLLIAVALFVEHLWRQQRWLAPTLMAGLLAFNLAAHLYVVRDVPPGITAQMNPALWLDNETDSALIAFVKEQGGLGYSHHWISYKIAYLSDNEVILAAFLPFHEDLDWNPLDDRYEPYAEAVAQSASPVYVIHRAPHLLEAVPQAFAAHDISYQSRDIGPYRVYYDLSAAVSPREIGLGGPE